MRQSKIFTEEMGQVIQLAAQGETSESSARILGIGYHSARERLRSSIRCLGAKNICNAVAIAIHRKLIDFQDRSEE